MNRKKNHYQLPKKKPYNFKFCAKNTKSKIQHYINILLSQKQKSHNNEVLNITCYNQSTRDTVSHLNIFT